MPTQKEICDHLETLRKQFDADKALRDKNFEPNEFWIFSEKLKQDDIPNRYFSIVFGESRTDRYCLQTTTEYRKFLGYLKIDAGGNISVVDKKLKTYDSSCVFTFENNKLIMTVDDEIMCRERRSSACLKFSVITVGVGITVAACAALNGTIKYRSK